MSNLLKRILSGIAFVIIMVSCLLACQYSFAALILFLMVTMLSEFYRITMGESYKLARIMAVCTGVFFFLILFLFHSYGYAVSKYIPICIIPVIATMTVSLYNGRERADFAKTSFIYAGLLYIAFPLALSNRIAFHSGGFNGALILSFFIIIWLSDSGAYIFGMLLGNKIGKRLFPEISPKKSWAGFWGGLILAICAAIALNLLGILHITIVQSVILGIVMHIAGVYGDLFESQWKRAFGIKDSGKIIPGHGGMLDRFDSALFAIPAGAIYLLLFDLL